MQQIMPGMTAASALVVVALVLGLQAPPGWDATHQRASRLILDENIDEAVAILDEVLEASPDFDAARYEVAEAHRMAALA
jgi:hypothetical protein